MDNTLRDYADQLPAGNAEVASAEYAEAARVSREAARRITDLIEQGAPAFEAAVPILSQPLKAELAEREVRSIAYHMKSARFPA